MRILRWFCVLSAAVAGFIVLNAVFSPVPLAPTNWATSDTKFDLHFPKDQYLGELWLIEDVNCFSCGTGQKYLGRAQGIYHVQLPAQHWFVSLRMPKEASKLMPFLKDESLNNIGEVDLRNSDVRDSDLAYLSHMKLQYLNLSGTQIIGEGFQYLHPHERWFRLDINNTRHLNEQNLSHFRGWKRMTITIGKYPEQHDYVPQENDTRWKEAQRIVCDNQPENVCGTQIR